MNRLEFNNISKVEFAYYLMECWYMGTAGDWAKDLANQIYKEVLEEVINNVRYE